MITKAEQADFLEKAFEEGEAIAFTVSSGGIYGMKHIPKEDIIRFDTEFAYTTQSKGTIGYNGDAHKETVRLQGRYCGKDEQDRHIICLKSGKVVYYTYVPGNASCFDKGVFEAE